MLPFETADVVEIVTAAAALSLQMRGRSPVEVKPDQTLVTAADRAVEAFLREKLAPLAPEYSVLGEEGGLTGAPDAPSWIIDPIDGTTNFVRGLPIWCISVGLVQNGECILGALAVPVLGEIYWGAVGEGAWLEVGGEKTRLSTPDRVELMQEDLIAYNTTVEQAVDFSRVTYSARNLGSVAYHLLALARGSLCATVAARHKIYDVAGGLALCRETGCEVRHLNGSEWSAQVSMERAEMPLLVAPPGTMKLLLAGLSPE
jgi:fructose-1,6-bisphosphatase/inositol monophosphatase family enzyme